MQPPQIDYAPALPHQNRRRMIRRAAFGLAVLILVFLAIKSGPPAWCHVQILYWQHRAMNYAPPAGRIVYDDDPSEAPALRSANQSLSTDPEGDVFEFATPWDRLYRLVSPPGQQATATLFMHERQNTKGERRLVVVQARPYGGSNPVFANPAGVLRLPDQAFEMEAIVFVPGTAFSLPRELDSYRAWTDLPDSLIFLKPTHFRWYAGQVDPGNRAHFTIRGQMNGHPVTVDGWLRDDDQVEFIRTPAP